MFKSEINISTAILQDLWPLQQETITDFLPLIDGTTLIQGVVSSYGDGAMLSFPSNFPIMYGKQEHESKIIFLSKQAEDFH